MHSLSNEACSTWFVGENVLAYALIRRLFDSEQAGSC